MKKKRGRGARRFWCSRLSRMAARKAGQGVLLWSTGAAIAGVCWREHHTASSPWQQPTAGAPAKTLGQQSHNPLVRVTDEGRGLQSIARAFWMCMNSGRSVICFDKTLNKSEESSHVLFRTLLRSSDASFLFCQSLVALCASL